MDIGQVVALQDPHGLPVLCFACEGLSFAQFPPREYRVGGGGSGGGAGARRAQCFTMLARGDGFIPERLPVSGRGPADTVAKGLGLALRAAPSRFAAKKPPKNCSREEMKAE